MLRLKRHWLNEDDILVVINALDTEISVVRAGVLRSDVLAGSHDGSGRLALTGSAGGWYVMLKRPSA